MCVGGEEELGGTVRKRGLHVPEGTGTPTQEKGEEKP